MNAKKPNTFDRMGAIADGEMGLKAMMLYFNRKLNEDELEELLTNLEKYRLKGQKLWQFFEEVAHKDHSLLLSVLNSGDQRIARYQPE